LWRDSGDLFVEYGQLGHIAGNDSRGRELHT
jgi:hypothetical protein